MPNGLRYWQVGGRGEGLRCRKNLKGEKSQKIRTLPTCPVHAMLDELLVYRDYDFDYSPKSKSGHVLWRESNHQPENRKARKEASESKNK